MATPPTARHHSPVPPSTPSSASDWQATLALIDDAKLAVEQVVHALDSAMARTVLTLTCSDCGPHVPTLRWRPTSDVDVTHLGAYCSTRERRLKWLPQRSPWLELVEQQRECGGAA